MVAFTVKRMEIGFRLRKGNKHLRLTQIPLSSRKKSQFDISQQLTEYFIMTGTERLEGLLLIECFRFWDEDEEEDEIFSVLSSALAWANVILAGKRDSRRHSTTSFSESVVVAGISF